MSKAQFENCISLGYYCATATAMAKNGLRSFSGPFDWYVSDLESVLDVINTDFIYFMQKENLKVKEDNPLVFTDTKYGFICSHDIQNNFEQEYHNIYIKYNRRAARFMEATKSPTCLFRIVKSNEEVEYINKNAIYINDVIKKNNPNNEIVFLKMKSLNIINANFKQFDLDISGYYVYRHWMRCLFEKSKDLIDYISSDYFNKDRIRKNREYDYKNQILNKKPEYVIEKMMQENEKINEIVKKLACKTVYLWGAGYYGKIINEYLLKHNVYIKAFIDNDDNKVNGKTIVSPKQIDKENNAIIIISIANMDVSREIKKQIVVEKIDCKVVTFEDLFNLLEGI